MRLNQVSTKFTITILVKTLRGKELLDANLQTPSAHFTPSNFLEIINQPFHFSTCLDGRDRLVHSVRSEYFFTSPFFLRRFFSMKS